MAVASNLASASHSYPFAGVFLSSTQCHTPRSRVPCWRAKVRVSAPAGEGSPTSTAAGPGNSSQGGGEVLSGVVFDPFSEVKSQLVHVPASSSPSNFSFAKQRYSPRSEAAVNEQINVEYNISYVFHSLYSYFDRDNVGLQGLARLFMRYSDKEREDAKKLMQYQNLRGGRVKLQTILMPAVHEFDDSDRGDALFAMELALSLEKLVNEKLLCLHKVAEEDEDAQLMHYVDTEFLEQQVYVIKRLSDYVAQLRRVGKGHGVFHFDRQLMDGHSDGKA